MLSSPPVMAVLDRNRLLMRQVAVVAVLLSIGAGLARAQAPPGAVEVGVGGGRLYGGSFAAGSTVRFDERVGVDDDKLNTFWLGAQLTEAWGAELAVRRTATRLVRRGHGVFGSEPELGTIDLATIDALAVRSFRHGNFLPYVGAGAGIANLDINVSDPAVRDSDRSALILATGARFFARPWLGFRFDVRGHAIYLGRRHGGHDQGWNDSGRWLSTTEVVVGVFGAFASPRRP
jgi:opacity protein-like surface antigen